MKNDRDKTIWMDEELELALYRLAEKDGDRKFSAYCRMVLARHVDNCLGTRATSEAPNRGDAPRADDYEAEYWRAKYLRAIGRGP